MDRRSAIKTILAGGSLTGSALMTGCSSNSRSLFFSSPNTEPERRAQKKPKPQIETNHNAKSSRNHPDDNSIHSQKKHPPAQSNLPSDGDAQDRKAHLYKTKNFDQDHPGDLFVSRSQEPILLSCHQKLSRVQLQIGYGNFNLIGFDQFISLAKATPGIQEVSRAEQSFLEQIFYYPAKNYGFFGKKLQTKLTLRIKDDEVIKIPQSGHYLYREESLPIYHRIKRDIGETLILTSGIRSIVKQTQLFLAKVIKSNGNYSRASRSLAPPGFSYHSVGDFDVGKKGLGAQNFTSRFSKTDEYRRLIDLGYIDIRYPSDNPFGVRFEPWHIEGRSHHT